MVRQNKKFTLRVSQRYSCGRCWVLVVPACDVELAGLGIAEPLFPSYPRRVRTMACAYVQFQDEVKNEKGTLTVALDRIWWGALIRFPAWDDFVESGCFVLSRTAGQCLGLLPPPKCMNWIPAVVALSGMSTGTGGAEASPSTMPKARRTKSFKPAGSIAPASREWLVNKGYDDASSSCSSSLGEDEGGEDGRCEDEDRHHHPTHHPQSRCGTGGSGGGCPAGGGWLHGGGRARRQPGQQGLGGANHAWDRAAAKHQHAEAAVLPWHKRVAAKQVDLPGTSVDGGPERGGKRDGSVVGRAAMALLWHKKLAEKEPAPARLAAGAGGSGSGGGLSLPWHRRIEQKEGKAPVMMTMNLSWLRKVESKGRASSGSLV